MEQKILLRLPNWLGDSVMASAAFERLKEIYPSASFTLIGTRASCEIYARDLRVSRIIIDSTKDSKNRFSACFKLAREIGFHDIAIIFTNSFFSNLTIFLTKSKIRVGYGKNFTFIFLTHRVRFIKSIHQVLKYLNLANFAQIDSDYNNVELRLIAKNKFNKDENLRYIGINPGAAYGSAKRWEEKYFLEIILYFLKNNYKVFLFGTEEIKLDENIKNHEHFINLINKTNISELCDFIAQMDLFITNDSGPMHIAAALKIPIIAMFGPTDMKDTRPWSDRAILLNKNLPCAPCKKRECPLKHHNCMKLITPDEVIESALTALQTRIN